MLKISTQYLTLRTVMRNTNWFHCCLEISWIFKQNCCVVISSYLTPVLLRKTNLWTFFVNNENENYILKEEEKETEKVILHPSKFNSNRKYPQSHEFG